MIAILKKEEEEKEQLLASSHDHDQTNILDTYKLIWKILNIPSVKTLSVILITLKVAFADYDGPAYFKFLDAGVSNEKMIPLTAISMMPMRFILPFIVIRYTAGPKPLDAYTNTIKYRSLVCLSAALIIWITPKTISFDGVAPNYIYFVYLVNDLLYIYCAFLMRITLNATFIKISDPVVGGTYMTILNTIDNIGAMWPVTLSLWAVEYLTWRDCAIFNSSQVLHYNETQV